MAIQIKTTGEYMARDGSRVTVHEVAPIKSPEHWQANVKGSVWRMYRGKVRPKGLAIWTEQGRALPLRETSKDIVSRWYGHAFPCMLYDLDKARVHLTAEHGGMRYYCGGLDSFHAGETEAARLVELFGKGVSFYLVDSSGSHFLSAPIEELMEKLKT